MSSGTGNQYLSNNLSGTANFGLVINADPTYVMSGNDFTNSFGGVLFQNADMTGVTLTQAQLGIGMGTTGLAVQLSSVSNFTLDGLNVSGAGGTGIDLGGGLLISNGVETVAIDLSGAETVQDVLNQINNFAGAIRNEEELVITARDGIASVEAVETAYHALQKENFEPIIRAKFA